ncbi:hypothetical protein DL767_004846 [Monosporascus sp. MG133]|nr:hypothetical protein DL767_004846 [Monosporascus sp. MG133]
MGLLFHGRSITSRPHSSFCIRYMLPPSWLTYKPVSRGAQQTLASHIRSLCTALDKLYDPYSSLKPEGSGKLALGWAMFPLLGNIERLGLHSAPDPFRTPAAKGETPRPPRRCSGCAVPGFSDAWPRVSYATSYALPRRWSVSSSAFWTSRSCLATCLMSGFIMMRTMVTSGARPMPGPLHNSTRRALSSSGWTRTLAFPRLTHPHLFRPSECDPENYRDYDNIVHSPRAMEASLRDRARLLEPAQATVKTFVLEHRVVAENQELDGHASYNFFPKRRKIYMYGIFLDGQEPEELAALWRGRGAKLMTKEGVAEWTEEWSDEDED